MQFEWILSCNLVTITLQSVRLCHTIQRKKQGAIKMSRIIYKYPIDTIDHLKTELMLPVKKFEVGPKFLRVGLGVDDFPYVWVEHNSNETGECEMEKFVLHVIRTGDSFEPNNLTYLGSFVENPYYVWHIYIENKS